MALRGQNHGVYNRSKVWHFWVVTHIATLKLRQDNGLQTTDNGQAVAGGASQELRNYGTTDRASRLETQSSVTLYTFYTLLYPSMLPAHY